MVVEFIEGWNLHHILGEGTFGEVTVHSTSAQWEKSSYNDAPKVKLLVNKENGEACAMKEVFDSNHVTVDTRFKVLSQLDHAHYCSIAQFS